MRLGYGEVFVANRFSQGLVIANVAPLPVARRYASLADPMPTQSTQIPDESAWFGYQDDLDVRYMHRLFFGKSIDEVLEYFEGGRAIERCSELLFAPRSVFQYYIQAFVKFLMSENAAGESDAASPFLDLLASREKEDPGSVSAIFSSLASCIDYVASNQAFFEANEDIYGNFQEKAARIRALCGVQVARHRRG
jgi:hypothetical protein